MSHEEMVELRKKTNIAAAQLRQVHAELEMKVGISSSSQKIGKLVAELEKFRIYKLDDILFEFEESKG